MKTITQEELDKKLKLHELWLNHDERGVILDLSRTDLRGLNLTSTNLSGANLEHADLSNTNLSGTNLSHGILKYANLKGVNLIGADLSGTNLTDADLSYVNLIGANLVDTNLSGANLSFTDLRNSNLVGSNLTDANLKSTNFSNANTANIQGLKVFSVDSIGTFKGKATYIPKLDKVFAGCWKGSLKEFLKQGLEMNKENEVKAQNIRLAYQFFKNNSTM